MPREFFLTFTEDILDGFGEEVNRDAGVEILAFIENRVFHGGSYIEGMNFTRIY
jgi:hypothetical protein